MFKSHAHTLAPTVDSGKYAVWQLCELVVFQVDIPAGGWRKQSGLRGPPVVNSTYTSSPTQRSHHVDALL